MAVKVAINGFGRIGRLAFRQMFGAEGYEVVAIVGVEAGTISITFTFSLLLSEEILNVSAVIFPGM